MELARKSHEAALKSGNQKMIDRMMRQEQEYKAKLGKLDKEKEKRIRILEQDFQRFYKDKENKQMLAVLEKQLEETAKIKDVFLKEMKTMRRQFDIELEKSETERQAKDVEFKARWSSRKVRTRSV